MKKKALQELLRTKKIPNRKVCFATLGGLKFVVMNHTKDREDFPNEELSMFIYTVQISYDAITTRSIVKK